MKTRPPNSNQVLAIVVIILGLVGTAILLKSEDPEPLASTFHSEVDVVIGKAPEVTIVEQKRDHNLPEQPELEGAVRIGNFTLLKDHSPSEVERYRQDLEMKEREFIKDEVEKLGPDQK